MFKTIISLENLLGAWQEFNRGKSKKPDVQEFYSVLEENLFELHASLQDRTYTHGGYHAFKISDPKPRDIHKAGVRDRLVHHALYRILYPFFDRTFIPDSYSCRLEKGTHKAMNRFRRCALKESRNHTKTVWVLKCDIKKFFASIDHGILLKILEARIADADILWLLREVISSFSSKIIEATPLGLPLGNLTSQLFA
ncbi:MAG: reverse transcriptase domain-containing protein, partial [bacterium]|nr:reverse transcriptase domain-containing protein [bacterium]